ncbi:MAG: hypothetical protein IJH25_11805 [Clostridia bacterium]|nr:hypothetical protein [Clostridia bacterium]
MLILVIVGALSLSASVIVRSVRTARLNRRLAVMHNVSGDQMEAEVAAPPVESEIQTEQAAPGAAPVTVFHRTDLDILPEMQKLARENPDTIDWLGIGGVVYQPVVYWDNSYYLDHDFTGAGNASGTLFVVSHRRPAVVLRAYGNFDLWLISRLIPRLYRTALSLEPSHFAYLLV